MSRAFTTPATPQTVILAPVARIQKRLRRRCFWMVGPSPTMTERKRTH